MSEKTIGAAKFKEKCLSYLDEVDKNGIVITKNGKPVARLVPYFEERDSYIGKFENLIKVHGSTFSTGIKWNAES